VRGVRSSFKFLECEFFEVLCDGVFGRAFRVLGILNEGEDVVCDSIELEIS